MVFKRGLVIVLSAVLFLSGASYAFGAVVRVGVLAKRGPERCLSRWSPTAEYLTEKIPGTSFRIVPIDFDRIHTKVEAGEVDFILANPSFYVTLERWYAANRIATLKNRRLNGAYTTFGSVIFCRKENKEIRRLTDLSGKRFMAVKETSFGGWQMAWREMKDAGVDPETDFAELLFGGTHDAVVYAVKSGKVDAGAVRTDTLERMQGEGIIRIDDFHVIHTHGGGRVHLPFAHSTREYPEWPMAKVRHTPDLLAEKVAVALLEMPPDARAAIAAECAGWTIPLNYQTVHECLKTLKVEPYLDFGKITFGAILHEYGFVISLLVTLFTLMTLSIVLFVRMNRNIAFSRDRLATEVRRRKRLYEKIEGKNADLEKALSEIKVLRGILPICAHCKKVRDDRGYWNKIEAHVEAHSAAEFTHGICPDCAREHFPDYDIYED